jgi:hypothetical protein
VIINIIPIFIILANMILQLWIDVLINSGVPVELCHVKVWEGEDQLLNNESDWNTRN